MFAFNTPNDALQAIAGFVKTSRLNQNITMEDLAIRSGIGIATLARVEKKGVCSTDNLAKIFAALGKLDILITALKPEENLSISELRALSNKKPKQRARKTA